MVSITCPFTELFLSFHSSTIHSQTIYECLLSVRHRTWRWFRHSPSNSVRMSNYRISMNSHKPPPQVVVCVSHHWQLPLKCRIDLFISWMWEENGGYRGVGKVGREVVSGNQVTKEQFLVLCYAVRWLWSGVCNMHIRIASQRIWNVLYHKEGVTQWGASYGDVLI